MGKKYQFKRITRYYSLDSKFENKIKSTIRNVVFGMKENKEYRLKKYVKSDSYFQKLLKIIN